MTSRTLNAAQASYDDPEASSTDQDEPSLALARRIGAWMHRTGRTRPWHYARRNGGRIEVNDLIVTASPDGTQFERVS